MKNILSQSIVWVLVSFAGPSIAQTSAPVQVNVLPVSGNHAITPVTIDTAVPDVVQGIDLYEGIGIVDFDQVKKAGFDLVIPRATWGTYADARFVNNIKAIHAAGLRAGAYCFFRPKLNLDQQVAVCAAQIQAAGGFIAGDIGPVADFEDPKAFKGVPRSRRLSMLKAHLAREWKSVSKPTRLGLVLGYLQGIENKVHWQPLVYGSSQFFTEAFFGDLTPLDKYLLWVADYNKVTTPEVPPPWNKGKGWTIWQTTAHGHVPGQKPDADIDIFNGDHAALIKLFGALPTGSGTKP